MHSRRTNAVILTVLIVVSIVAAGCGGGGGSSPSGPTTFTITYNGNGNTGGSVPVDPVAYQQGQTVTVLGNTGSLVKAGSTFSGWNTQADGLGATYAPTQTFTIGAANVTLYAKWTLIPTYSMIYSGNSNTSGTVPTDLNNYLQGAMVTVLGNTGGLTKNGYAFSGWNTVSNGTGTTYQQGDTFTMGAADVTLYAKWTNHCASGPAAQLFDAVMHGCSGTVTFANRATLCAAGARVCSADQWVARKGATDATHFYWTDDMLRWSINATGPCGTSVCGTGNCFVSAGNTFTTSCGGGQSMLIAPALGKDAEGNDASWRGCGFNSILPNLNFGGCGSTAGAVCCSGLITVFVDAVSGLDWNPGTSAAPFKTITKALSVATVTGDQVNVKPGTYDTANGEIFPMQVPAGVILIGDEPNRGNGATPTKISGGSVSLGAGATLAGFFVTGTTGNGIVPSAGNAVIRNNSIKYSVGYGVYITQGSGHLVSLNSGTGGFGALYTVGVANVKVENNTFAGNTWGVAATGSSVVDLGGGAYSGVGNNILSCNTSADAGYFATGGTFYANNNLWDHNPPNISSSITSTIDIYNNGGGNTISTLNSRLSPSACP